MNTMDNAKVIKTMEKQTLQRYLEKLVNAEMHKITLFTIFSQTGAPNISDPKEIVVVDNTSILTMLNSGAVLN